MKMASELVQLGAETRKTHQIFELNGSSVFGEGLLTVLVNGVDRMVLEKELIHLVALAEEAHVLARTPAAERRFGQLLASARQKRERAYPLRVSSKNMTFDKKKKNVSTAAEKASL